MPQATPLTRLYRLSRDRRRVLLEAVYLLVAASAAVALLPFRSAIGFGSKPLGRRTRVSPDDCVWAVEAAALRLPWRTMCIQKGLAVQRLLRRNGIGAVVHYGARRDAEVGKLEAHVWVSVDGVTIIGGEEAPAFAEVAAFP